MSKLFFYYSTMNAGKSTNLLQASYNYKEQGFKTILFTFDKDNREFHKKIDGDLDNFEENESFEFKSSEKTKKVSSRIGISEEAYPFNKHTDFRYIFEDVFNHKKCVEEIRVGLAELKNSFSDSVCLQKNYSSLSLDEKDEKMEEMLKEIVEKALDRREERIKVLHHKKDYTKLNSTNDEIFISQYELEPAVDFFKNNSIAYDIKEELYNINDFNVIANKLGAIFIDEAQFLTEQQVKDLAYIVDTYNVPVLCYGLRTDFLGTPFEGSKWLLAWADELNEMKTICKTGKKATFVLRLDENGKPVTDGAQIQIGGNESYLPVSRKIHQQSIKAKKLIFS